MFQQTYLNRILVIEFSLDEWKWKIQIIICQNPAQSIRFFVAILNKTLSLTPNKRGFGFYSGKRQVQWLLVMLLLFDVFQHQNSELEETNNQTKSGLIHCQQKMWSVGFRLKRKLGHMMMVSGYLLQNWDSEQDPVSPGLGVTNLTSEKWREELGSESSRRARGERARMEG